MTIGATASYTRGGSSAATWDTGTITAPSDGDLVYIYIHSNGASGFTIDAAGSTWETAILNAAAASEGAYHAIYWKVAGASEPTSYSGTGASAEYRSITKVTAGGGTGWEIDASLSQSRTTSKFTSMISEAQNGATVSSNSISFITSGKDRRGGTALAYTTADNSYTGVVGNRLYQNTAGAHRVFAPGQTISVDVTITPVDASDNIFSTHVSFIESGGSPASIIPQITQQYYRNN